ncbi:hypothetical protein JCM5296_000873 [Sporobolomyces johnsonii]
MGSWRDDKERGECMRMRSDSGVDQPAGLSAGASGTEGLLGTADSTGETFRSVVVEVLLLNKRPAEVPSSSSSATNRLPALLSHLSLYPTFPPPTVESCACAAFSFSSSSSSTSYVSRPTSNPAPIDAFKLAADHTHAGFSKRPTSTPDAHLPSPERLKKRKLLHRFIRSEALLSGPPSPAHSSSGQRSSPTRPPLDLVPAWWPSVSRCFGEGVESRFAPSEEEWTGRAEGWEAKLSWSSRRGEGALRSETGIRRADFWSAQPSRPLPLRAASSPASIGHGPAPSPDEPPRAAEQPTGPALKQLLLSNLRARLASEGGTSRAGEAGLRFKKWVVFNAWQSRTKQHLCDDVELEDDDDDLLFDSSLLDDHEDGDREPAPTSAEDLYLPLGSDSLESDDGVFTIGGQMLDMMLPTPPASSADPILPAIPTNYTHSPPPASHDPVSPSPSPSRPGLRRSATTPTLPSMNATPRSPSPDRPAEARTRLQAGVALDRPRSPVLCEA